MTIPLDERDDHSSALVFVYGSLRQGESNHGLLSTSELVASSCQVRGELYDLGCGYPALLVSDTDWATGELYRVKAETLRKLDELEGYHGPGMDNDYNRESLPVVVDGVVVNALVYTYTRTQVTGMQRVACGDWSRHLRNSQGSISKGG